MLVSQGTANISENAKEDFVETPYHSELSSSFQIITESESSQDKHVIKAIRETNKKIVDELKSIAKTEIITFDDIQEQSWNNPLKSFMYAVASAEGLTSN